MKKLLYIFVVAALQACYATTSLADEYQTLLARNDPISFLAIIVMVFVGGGLGIAMFRKETQGMTPPTSGWWGCFKFRLCVVSFALWCQSFASCGFLGLSILVKAPTWLVLVLATTTSLGILSLVLVGCLYDQAWTKSARHTVVE